jgi:hypothetical protein
MDRRQDCFAIAALGAMLAWFCDEMIFSSKVPFFRDLAAYFYPIKFSVAEAFRSGELPLWDLRMAAGFPIMAGLQSAVFYPPSFAFYLLPFFAALRFTFVFHYAIAAAGAFVLFRSWKYPVYIALIGANLFAFGGTTVSLTNLLNHFQSAVWLPWVVYFWECTVRLRRWKDIAAFSIVALFQLLAGSPEIFVLSMGLAVLDTARLQRDEQMPGFFRAMAILIGSGCIILGLGMVQLLPTAELILQSRRDQPIPASEALGWSLRPSSLIGLLLPTLEADSSLTLGVRLLLAQGVPFLLSHYMGVIGVFGLCCWCRTACMKDRVIVLALISGSLLLAFGSYTPVYPFLYEWVPVFRALRFPEKYYYVTFALLIFATVRGLRQVDDGENSHTSWVVATSILAIWLISYVSFRWQPQWLAEFLQPANLNQVSPSANPTTIAAILVILEKQVGISLVLAALFCLNRLGVIRRTLLQCFLVLAVFFDLSSANKPLHFLRDATLTESIQRILEKPLAEPGRLFYYPPGENLHPSYVRVTGSPDYAKATEISLNNLLPNAGMLYGFEYFQDIDALGRRSYTNLLHFINALPPERRGKLLGALNVKYVVAFHALEVKGLKIVREFPEHYSRLYEVTDTVPRTYVAARAIHERDPQSILRRLSTDEFDLLREVIVDSPIPLAPKGVFQGNAAIKLYRNNQVQIDAQLSEPGILVLTDAFYPGWKARVDGKERKILRANYLFRGVELPAGNHKVEFIYDPESFKVGLAISLFTIGLLMTVPLIGWFRKSARVAKIKDEISETPVRVVAE